MTQEEKQLLLKDLCARLPYGVKIWTKWDKNPSPLTTYILENYWYTVGNDIKPYLRPMSSMTDDEKKTLNNILEYQYCSDDSYMCEASDWLNENYFDFRRLIEKGLALEAKEGMYEV